MTAYYHPDFNSRLATTGRKNAYLQVGKRGTKLWIVLLAQEQIPESLFLCFLLELFHNRDDSLPSCLVVRNLEVSKLLSWLNLFLQFATRG